MRLERILSPVVAILPSSPYITLSFSHSARGFLEGEGANVHKMDLWERKKWCFKLVFKPLEFFLQGQWPIEKQSVVRGVYPVALYS